MADEKSRRAAFALAATTAEKWVWIADPDHAFIAAKVTQQFDDGSMEVRLALAGS